MLHLTIIVWTIFRRKIRNNQLERIWKEAAAALSRYYPDICLEGLGNLNILSHYGGNPAAIRAAHFTNIWHKNYYSSQIARWGIIIILFIIIMTSSSKVKLFLQQAVEAHRIVRRRGSQIFKTIGSQMAVRLSALFVGRPFPPPPLPGWCLVLISVRGWVNPRPIARLEGLGQLKNPMTSSGIEHAAFWLVA
jgi:hypothetical protein